MSRVSLTRRLETIRNAADRIDPFASRVHRLSPALRASYDRWRDERGRSIASLEARDGPGGAYAAMIEDTVVMPDPPQQIADALGIAPIEPLLADATCDDLAQRYAAMIER